MSCATTPVSSHPKRFSPIVVFTRKPAVSTRPLAAPIPAVKSPLENAVAVILIYPILLDVLNYVHMEIESRLARVSTEKRPNVNADRPFVTVEQITHWFIERDWILLKELGPEIASMTMYNNCLMATHLLHTLGLLGCCPAINIIELGRNPSVFITALGRRALDIVNKQK